MTQDQAAMPSSHGTGDINLAAAVMAMGIPPDELTQCAVISKGSRDYCRFYVQSISNCGKFETMKLMAFWSASGAPANHPFGWIMDFITARPQGCSSAADWLDHAFDTLSATGNVPKAFPRKMAEIPAMVASLPEARASYLLAFVHCREFCLSLTRQARRQVMMTSGDGERNQIIDSRLPVHVRNNLIARLDG